MQYTEKWFDGNRRLLYAWFSAMHTRVDLVVHAGEERTDLISIAGKTEKEISRIEAFANRFNKQSELSQVNRQAYNQAVPVSKELFSMLADCQQFHRQSSGYFDVTVNSMNSLAGGMNFLELDSAAKSVKFHHRDLLLDLSGYLKGYALSKVVGLLRSGGIENALINFGNSSVYALGNHPHGKGWRINSEDKGITSDLAFCNECLTTSGFRENREWPVINPLTGTTLGKGKQVSVLTSDSTVGEVVSKIACMAKEEELEELLKRFNAQIA